MMIKPNKTRDVPAETSRVAKAAFSKGNLYLRIRDEFGALYQDEDFAELFPDRGQPTLSPWRLAAVTVVQFLENLSDRGAADAVRARIDLKYLLGLEPTDPGFDYSALSEFRGRLVEGNAEQVLLDHVLALLQKAGLVKARGKQRTDATHVLASIRVLNRLALSKKLGAAHAFDAREDAETFIREAANGRGVDLAVECAGAESALVGCLKATKRGGTVVVVGLGDNSSYTLPLLELAVKELDLKGVFRYVYTYPAALNLLTSGAVDVEAMITHHFPLDEMLTGIEYAEQGTDGAVKVMIKVQRNFTNLELNPP